MIFRLFAKVLLLAVIMFLVESGLGDLLKIGLDRYDGLDRKPDILCIGNSQTISGIDENRLALGLGVPVTKFARNGVNIFERNIMVVDFFKQPTRRPQVVIYDVNPELFLNQRMRENSYTRFFPYMDTPEVADYLKTKCSDKTEFITRKYIKLLRYNNPWLVRCSIKGHLRIHDSFTYSKINYVQAEAKAKPLRSNAVDFDIRNYNCFIETIRFLRSKEVKVVLLYIPTLDLYNRHHEEEGQFVESTLLSLAAKDNGILFLNYSKRYQSVHEYFSDFEHVNRDGQIRVTDDLINDISPFIVNNRNTGL